MRIKDKRETWRTREWDMCLVGEQVSGVNDAPSGTGEKTEFSFYLLTGRNYTVEKVIAFLEKHLEGKVSVGNIAGLRDGMIASIYTGIENYDTSDSIPLAKNPIEPDLMRSLFILLTINAMGYQQSAVDLVLQAASQFVGEEVMEDLLTEIAEFQTDPPIVNKVKKALGMVIGGESSEDVALTAGRSSRESIKYERKEKFNGKSSRSSECKEIAFTMNVVNQEHVKLRGEMKALKSRISDKQVIIPELLIPVEQRQALRDGVVASDIRIVSETEMEELSKDAINPERGKNMVIIITPGLMKKYHRFASSSCQAQRVVLNKYDDKEGLFYLDGAIALARAVMIGNDDYIYKLYKQLTNDDLSTEMLAEFKERGEFSLTLPDAKGIDGVEYKQLIQQALEFLIAA